MKVAELKAGDVLYEGETRTHAVLDVSEVVSGKVLVTLGKIGKISGGSTRLERHEWAADHSVSARPAT